jgi:hypothetical protein
MNVALYSSNYHPAHAQHMHAYALALQDCGLSVCLWAPAVYFEKHIFLRGFSRASDTPCEVVIVLNMGLMNIPHSALWRLQGRRVLFCVHEPIHDISDYKSVGLSKMQFAKLWVMRFLIIVQIWLSTSLIAFSRKTVRELAGGKRVVIHPLLYVDQNTNPSPPVSPHQTIAYIGSIARDHAFGEFVNFVEHCLENDLFSEYRFVIATSSAFEKSHFAAWGPEKASRVVVQSGRFLSDEEINVFYAGAAVLWCAYKRSNQSGVLPKAYMFGVPVLVKSATTHDYFQANRLGMEITSYAVDDITQAIDSILSDRKRFSNYCRNFYKTTFDYKANLPVIKKLMFLHE